MTTGHQAHPRSRGADPVAAALVRIALGSSPLARGGPVNADGTVNLRGLIPARAGRTARRGES